MRSEELKPCPFCGEPGEEREERGWYACSNNDCPAWHMQAELPDWNRRDALSAQLAAIRAAVGEVVEVVGWLGGNGIHAEEHMASGAPFPLMTVAQHQRITAAMAAEVERLSLLIDVGAKLHLDAAYGEIDLLEKERDALRAELAAVKGQEPVLWCDPSSHSRTCTAEQKATATGATASALAPLTMPLYAHPPASPDVEGLVKNAARYEWLRDHYHGFEHYRKSTGTVANLDREIDDQIAAISNWRQSTNS